ncbi:hypothetical protein V8C37DRAFT_374952 [Trichoderma ceciliae]
MSEPAIAMSQDRWRSQSIQEGVHRVGPSRGKRDSNQGHSQRSSSDAGSNPKRPRTVEQPEERSPVAQRDRSEVSSPTTSTTSTTSTALVPHRQRHPDTPKKQHLARSSSKVDANSLSAASLKQLLDLCSDRLIWYKIRSEAVKAHKRITVNQEQHQHRPSDYASSSELLAKEHKQSMDEIRRAEKFIAELDDKLASALQPLLKNISESWAKNAAPSSTSEEPAATEARLNVIQDAIKREMEISLKKGVTESQQSMKELLGSQMSKLKESLAQETEQKMKSLRKTLVQEGEERANSLRKTLVQDNEKRIADVKLPSAGENKSKIAELENALAKESRKNAVLDRKVADLEARLDKITSEQRELLESLVNKTQLAQHLQQLSNSQDEKLAKLEASLDLRADNSPRMEDLARQVCNHSKLINEKTQQQDDSNTRLGSLESTMSKLAAEGLENIAAEVVEIKERVQNLNSNHEPAPISDDKILEVIRPELTRNTNNTREMIMHIQEKLRPFLEQERHRRETLEEQFGDFTRQISELQKESITTKAEHSRLKEELNGQGQIYSNELGWLEGRVNDRINSTIGDFTATFEGVFLQLQGLNAWQANFNTRGLYRDILGHINSTLPDGTLMQLKTLRQRVEVIETRMSGCENNTSNKKRKLSSGSSKAVNGHQTDA